MSTGRKSMGGGNHNYGRSPHHRPSSIPAPTTMRTDTRPISDKTYFNTCVRNLHSYLVQNNYEYPIKLKDLARPSAKDFHNIMIFLLSRIDVSFYNNHAKGASSGMASERGGNNQQKRKFEDDVTMMFKALGYPFNISKTALVAAGSPHTWPSLLLAITWLIELLTSMSDEFLYEDDILFLNQQIDNVDEDADYIFNDIAEAGEQTLEDNNTIMDDLMIVEQRIKTAIQIYVERSYGTFINADDELYQKMEDQLLEYIEKDHMMIEHAIERLTDENGVIVERITDVEKEFER
jgi:kinetochore protein NDC80